MPQRWRDLVVTLVHLALFAQLGVLTRIYLDKLFATCKPGPDFGTCLTSEGLKHNTLGAYFTDIASNMLGSFIMGLLAAGATLGLSSKKEIAILPAKSSWQSAPELHIGLRTGYCGSLTTFASWEYSLVTSLLGGLGKEGGQWTEFLWGMVIGLQTALSSYVFGQYCAMLIDRYITPGGRAEADLEKMAAMQTADIQASRAGELTDAEKALQMDEYETEGPSEPGFHYKTHIGAGILLALSTALFLALFVLDNSPKHISRQAPVSARGRWLAVLFGPIGCTLRWTLSKTNYTLPGEWKWLPIGTFAANMLACTVNYFIGGTSSHLGKLSMWSTIVTYAIRTGFSGALSTVSTFVAEITAQFRVLPEKLHGFIYAVGSLFTGALLGVIIYGSMVWTA
ncbi:hypothetical protein COCSUDRAFT_43867 [Coccomyxa subellipsoidea C-169]|uniref:Fluoride ion transporter CrcB n=1 Tax=Coccomyxa subellipsoidea (strain C-169) TaxID=574566 RepID=I0YPV2_COCSC|nr:hypothetical protein COCSUDRAFT_43867 [Coccomyxa subellipsoidea C-169]EIE20421.1 hypothetical protein COCSUDRAFT_43867 [Coccomyxa subellipsoidea C-169]|eukprot:XP_005644965.1 hypothetical protein COCSUDRAFT_43867 [Coccomyxa subellipsoidea C-169]